MKRALIDLRSILWTGLMAGKGEKCRECKHKWRYEPVIDKTKE